MLRSPLLGLVGVALCTSAGGAQLAAPAPYAKVVPYPYASGTFVNSGAEVELVNRAVIGVDGAPSVRVFFRELNLGPNDYVDVVGLAEGYSHRITPAEIAKWNASSAFFNGDFVELALYVAPGSKASYEVSHLLAGTSGPAGDTICGATDDRVPSLDNRVGRFLSADGHTSCTGWLSGADGCAFSAGHCFPSFATLAEFNLPLSTVSGALQHPSPEFQFPVDPTSVTKLEDGDGFDYGICLLEPNPLGESAAAKLGYFELGFFLPSVDDVVRVTGCGEDDGTANRTLQTDAGPYAGLDGVALSYVVDTENGSSGSAVIDEASGRAIGIHTDGGCSVSGGDNYGTSFTLPAFQAAWAEICEHGTPGVPSAMFSASPTSVVATGTVKFYDDSTGVPTSWAWDFNEDGIVDSNLRNPCYSFAEPGTFDVELTVANSFGSDTVKMVDFITVVPITPVGIPCTQDFQQGLPASAEWVFKSSDDLGKIVAGSWGTGSGGTGGSGNPALAMSSKLFGHYVTNEAKLFIDASQYGGFGLRYVFKNVSDEDDPEDGLFLSDGVTEVLIKSHQGTSSSWDIFTPDVMGPAAAAGIVLDESLHLIFRHRGTSVLGTDGHLIDDVIVTGWPHLDALVPSISLSLGGTQFLSLKAGLARANDYFWLLGSLSGTSPGTAIGSFLLPLNTPDAYFTFTLLHPNQAPLSNSLGVLGPDGSATASFSLPAGSNPALWGIVLNHAYVAFDPLTAEVTLVSNAESLTFKL